MIFNRIFYLLSFILSSSLVNALGTFELNTNTQTAYEKVMELRFKEAQILLDAEKKENPNNKMTYLVENYIDFFTVYINEEESEFNRLEPNKELRLNQLKQGDPDSPYFLYSQAEIRMHWAIARMKFEEYFYAFREVRKAYKLLVENEKKFPNFKPNKKTMGILHAIVGTIPDNYKWGVNVLGMKGTFEQGKQELQEVIKYSKTNDFLYEEETIIMYSFLILHLENQGDEAWELITDSDLDPSANPLACFVQASVALHTKRNDEAIEILLNRPKGNEFHPFLFLDYMLGLCKLYRQDEDSKQYFEAYVQNFKGVNYIKEGYQKMAWYELLQDNKEGFNQNMKHCLTKGYQYIDPDKKAHREAEFQIVPQKDLLKARLLFDGGYFAKSLEALSSLNADDFSKEKEKIEFIYRKGRILQALNKNEEAIEQYNYTILLGQDKPFYFACNAALQAGIIYEKTKEEAKALKYYKMCLSMKPDEYKSGLHQRAKAGLNRLEN